jgi:hypothetical protein
MGVSGSVMKQNEAEKEKAEEQVEKAKEELTQLNKFVAVKEKEVVLLKTESSKEVAKASRLHRVPGSSCRLVSPYSSTLLLYTLSQPFPFLRPRLHTQQHLNHTLQTKEAVENVRRVSEGKLVCVTCYL